MGLRFRVQPRDVPPSCAARVLGLSAERFRDLLPELRQRGFPEPDPTTGNYDLESIGRWQDARSGLAAGGEALDAAGVVGARLERLARLGGG
jgi:DNA-binding IclR family transcriptional regulator